MPTIKKYLYGPILSMGFNYFKATTKVSMRLQGHYNETDYFLPLSPLKFLVLIWSTSKGWKAELTLKPPSSFEVQGLLFSIDSLTSLIDTENHAIWSFQNR